MLTVIFATHNGERTLPTVLDAYQNLKVPSGGWKLVVVDNASTDRTATILDRFESQLPMTRLHVGEPGKNRALNAGIEFREGDLVVLTDDDAVPAANWLSAMRRAVDENGDYDVFGGAIVPRWERQPEAWLLSWVPHDITYSLTEKGRASGPVSPGLVFGPNMAVRTSLFDAGNRFDVLIGPKAGGTYAMGSETEFAFRMERLGHKTWFAADAHVEHMIRAFQMEKDWILSRAVRYGRSMYRRDLQRGHPATPAWLGMPRWKVRQLIERAGSLALSKVVGSAEQVFRDALQLRYDWGYLCEARFASRK